jgi:DNA excision repair protein ERCC-2
LDASYYADVVICDYNYAFCPRTHLIRYFDDETQYHPILLIDEAHNLVSRSKDMYSGSISKIKLLTLAKLLKENNCHIKKEFKDLLDLIGQYETKLDAMAYQVIDYDEVLVGLVYKLFTMVESFLDDNLHKAIISKNEIFKLVMDLLRFIKIAEFFDDDFIFTIEKADEDIMVSINCLDASKFILKTIRERTVGAVFFSATLYPIHYYKKMLTRDEGNFVSIDSPFEQNHLDLIAVDDVSTRYNDRSQSIEKIVDVIRILGKSKVGNYIVFFPSYKYLELVAEVLNKHSYDFEYIIQKCDFSVKEREDVINLFRQNEKTQIGLFVMGGMFAEGIDYIGDMLSGVIIVGTGLPMYGGYNNVVKSHFDEKFGDGFDFAYTYPGFSKVVQAVGRVIRTETDRGIAILIDDRFSSIKYHKLYPKEWSHMKRITDLSDLSEDINRFWDENK